MSDARRAGDAERSKCAALDIPGHLRGIAPLKRLCIRATETLAADDPNRPEASIPDPTENLREVFTGAIPEANGGQESATRAVLVVFWAGWLMCLILAAVVCRSLYGDGGYVVLGQLGGGLHYIDYDAHRSFASYITQTPVLLGQRLGAERVPTYAALYMAGVYLVPALLLLTALSLARKLPGLFAATAAAIVIFGFGANFVNTEAHLFLGLAWLAAVLLALPRPHPSLRGFALPMIAFVLLRVYEGMLLVGPVLAVGAFLVSREREGTQEQVGLTIAALLFTLGTFIGFSSFVAPRDPGNASSFLTSAFAYLKNPQAFELLAVACSLAATAVSKAYSRASLIIAAAALSVVFLWMMLGQEGYYAYTLYYHNRTFLVFLLPFAVGALLLIRRYRPARLERSLSAAGAMAMIVPFVAVVSADLVGSARWLHYMRDFCDVLDHPATASTGINQLKRNGAVTGWAWTHPTMSILLREPGNSAVVLDDPGQWQPFDPRTPMQLKYRGACADPLFHTKGRAQSDDAP